MQEQEGNSAQVYEGLAYDRRSLPVLHSVDAVVAGGSFGGISAALALARSGRSVALVEPRTYLGREVTATLRPWIDAHEVTGSADLAEPVLCCLEAGGAGHPTGEIPLHLDAIKTRLEDLLLEAGVHLLYASLPVGVLAAAEGLAGLVIGNKSGRQVLRCRLVVDATEMAQVARLAGAELEPGPGGRARFCRTLEFTGVGRLEGRILPVPEGLELAGNRVLVHAGCHGPDHVLVECAMDLPEVGDTALAVTRRETEARRRTMAVAAYLMAEVPAFERAWLAGASYELQGTIAGRLCGPVPTWARGMGGTTVEIDLGGSDAVRVPAASFAGPVVGLWCLSGAARVEEAERQALLDPVVASRAGASLGAVLARRWEEAASQATARTASQLAVSQAAEGTPGLEAAGLEVREPESPRPGRRYEQQPVNPCSVPIVAEVDVLVVGGGTSGATAAITAAREGMRTALVDMNPGLGGTGTYGGVDSYWFGRRVGFAARVAALVEQAHDRIRHLRPAGEIPRWNIEAKAWALLEEAEEAGVELLLNAAATGTVVQGDRVCGIVAATRMGPVALLAKAVIDATGDGDVAAFAGAGFVYGSERDHAAMWYSLAQFAEPGRTRNNFTSMVDISDVEDYTRAILAGRRRGPGHDHGAYVAPRESRHVVGEVVLTLTDQLRRRCWPDVVNVAFSNHDVKGQSNSDWLRAGLIPPNLEIEIPYRALLPRGLEGILVVGKALSATHDALPAIRMQADLENLGGAAALAAAMAVREGRSLRQVDMRALQARLAELDVLPAEVLDRRPAPRRYSEDELLEMIEAIDAGRPLYAYSDMELNTVFRERITLAEVCCAGPGAIPLLQRALAQAEPRRRILLAQALALVGSGAGVPVLVEALEARLVGDRLPERSSEIRHANYPPDQGAMPDEAYLLYSLGMARDPRALPVWRRVVELLARTTEADLRDRLKGVFYYVDAVCYGAERLGDPAAVPILEALQAQAPFHGQMCRSGFQVDFFQERQAYLELVIGRALARCGSPEGFKTLIAYLDDARALLARQAHSELAAIAGQDLGWDGEAWNEWLEAQGSDLQPVPWPGSTEPLRAWGEEMPTTP